MDKAAGDVSASGTNSGARGRRCQTSALRREGPTRPGFRTRRCQASALRSEAQRDQASALRREVPARLGLPALHSGPEDARDLARRRDGAASHKRHALERTQRLPDTLEHGLGRLPSALEHLGELDGR